MGLLTVGIGDGSITEGKIAANAVTEGKIADNSVTEAKMAAVATQTVTGNDVANPALIHNNKRSLLITLSGGPGAVHTQGTAVQAIESGGYVGQRLTIFVITPGGTTCFLEIVDNVATAKTNLRGNWKSVGSEGSTVGYTYLDIEWDGTVWQEVERYDGFGWTASGLAAHAEGQATASGDYSHAEGAGIASGGQAHAEGDASVASGNASHAEGTQAVADQFVQHAHSGGQFTSGGDAQGSGFVCRRAVTHSDANWYTIGINNTAIGPVIPAEGLWTFRAEVAGGTQDLAKSFSYLVVGTLKRIGNTTTLLASVITTLYEDDADFDCQVVADDTNEALSIQVQDTTSGSDAVRWVATIHLAQLIYT